MKNLLLKLTLAISVVIIVTACGNQNNQLLRKSITGRAGEMVIVISKESWEKAPGKILRNTIGQPQLALPQDEPLFDLIDVPHKAFSKIFKTTRNIITTRIASTITDPGVKFKDDVWASPQATVEIKARNVEEFEKLVTENTNKMISYFLGAERKRIKSNYRKIHDKGVLNTLRDKYDLEMYCQPGFIIAEKTNNFIWLKYETPEISQGIFVYTFEYKSDSTFTPDFLIKKRDSLLKKHVPGPIANSYMTTEKRIDPIFNIMEHNGNYASEMRGLWRVENDFMGGPYVMIAELDASRQRIVVADGYVFAPSKNKRNLLRQVEAMIYSIKFSEQEKNDKINSEIKMGN
jgi:hypothetical protein